MEERLRDLETERQQEIQRQILKEETEQRAKEEELRIETVDTWLPVQR